MLIYCIPIVEWHAAIPSFLALLALRHRTTLSWLTCTDVLGILRCVVQLVFLITTLPFCFPGGQHGLNMSWWATLPYTVHSPISTNQNYRWHLPLHTNRLVKLVLWKQCGVPICFLFSWLLNNWLQYISCRYCVSNIKLTYW